MMWAYCCRRNSMVHVSVGHICESCRNGWTDTDADWTVASGGPKEPCIRWGGDPTRKGGVGTSLGNWKTLGVSIWHFTQQKINKGDSRTAAAACSVPDWSLSHHIVPHEKLAPPCDAAFCQSFLTTVVVCVQQYLHSCISPLFLMLLETLISITTMLCADQFDMLLCRRWWPRETSGERRNSYAATVQCTSSWCKNNDCLLGPALWSCVCQAAYLHWQPSTYFRNNKRRVGFWCWWCYWHNWSFWSWCIYCVLSSDDRKFVCADAEGGDIRPVKVWALSLETIAECRVSFFI